MWVPAPATAPAQAAASRPTEDTKLRPSGSSATATTTVFMSPSHGTDLQQQWSTTSAAPTPRPPPPLPHLRSLTTGEQSIVSQTLYKHATGRDSNTNNFPIIRNYSNDQSLQLDSLECLHPSLWLNDECINCYFSLLNDRDAGRAQSQGSRLRYCYNTFFMTRLLQVGSARDGQLDIPAVQNWNRRSHPGFNIFQLEPPLFPINVDDNHWV